MQNRIYEQVRAGIFVRVFPARIRYLHSPAPAILEQKDFYGMFVFQAEKFPAHPPCGLCYS